jgi:hypothetical protein
VREQEFCNTCQSFEEGDPSQGDPSEFSQGGASGGPGVDRSGVFVGL